MAISAETNPESGLPNRESNADTPRRIDTLRRDLRVCTRDGFLYSIMVGLGETYLPLFVLALGAGELIGGLVATVPQAAGSLLQAIVPWLVRQLGSNKRFVLVCATIQSLSFVPLVVAAWLGYLPAWAAFLISSIYWGMAMGTGPAWNVWVGTVVPKSLRSGYFSKRARICQSGTVLGLAIAGVVLWIAKEQQSATGGFAVLFAIAAMCRGFSLRYLAAMSEPKPLAQGDGRMSTGEQATLFVRNRGGRMLMGMVLMTSAVQISGPFFNPYMVAHLDFSEVQITALLFASFFGKVVTPPMHGVIAKRFGVSRLLIVGAVGLVPLSALWAVWDNFWYLMLVQFFAGSAWAAYELASFLMLFETIPDRDRTRMLTTYNLANAAAILAGNMVGAAIIEGMRLQREAYIVLFLVSFAGRLLAVPVVISLRLPVTRLRRFQSRLLSVNPNVGLVQRPIVSSFEEDEGPNVPGADGESVVVVKEQRGES